jgi:hypothetical protein
MSEQVQASKLTVYGKKLFFSAYLQVETLQILMIVKERESKNKKFILQLLPKSS